MKKLRVAVLYGSRSTEHEVSIITALQVLNNLDKSRYDIQAVYITKEGQWILGNADFFKPEKYADLAKLVKKGKRIRPADLQVDLVLPIFHGTYGEDGTIQGLLETLNLPYAGPGVLAAAVNMDKVVQKLLTGSAGLPQVRFHWFYATDWQNSPSKVLADLKSLTYPLYVKPANGGSSIGITKVHTATELKDAIDVACFYDRRILVEESAENSFEVNISVLGNAGEPLKLSSTESPQKTSEVLSFSDKYESSGSKSAGMASAKRLVPAPLKKSTLVRIEQYASHCFNLLDCSGVARLDFLVSQDEKTIYLNEVNTIPGSLAYYLWSPVGLSFPQLLDQLITLGQARYQTQHQLMHTFSSNLLTNLGSTLSSPKLS